MAVDNGVIFLVDFENVHNSGFEGVKFLQEKDSVILFISEPCASKAKREYLETLINSGASVEYRKLVKTGKNGLDFYIASEVGFLRGKKESRPIAIISNDTGYGAIVDYWKMKGAPNNIFLKNTMENAFKLALPSNCPRYDKIAKGSTPVDIVDFIKVETNRIKQKAAAAKANEEMDWLKNIYADTEYVESSSEISNIIKNNNSLKDIYSMVIKTYGKKNGLNIYHMYKEAVSVKNNN